MWATVITGLTTLLGKWFENKKEESQAKHVRKLKEITGEIDLDHVSANDMQHSWKDEWLTLVFTTPIVVVFYGAIFGNEAVVDRMEQGLTVITGLPEWYQFIVAGIVAASFGIRTYQRVKKS